MSPSFRSVLRVTLMALSLPTLAVADDWPQWGGPQRDAVWRETGIVKKLPTTDLLPRVWSTPIKEGYSGPAVSNGRVYITDFDVLEARRGKERVVCLDAENGKPIWEHTYPAEGATPVIDDGLVYTIGAMGDMFCFQADSGDIVWQTNFVKTYGTELPTWGMAASPLVVGEQLITLVGGPNALVVSFNKKTGKENWKALNDANIGYCPPVLFEFGGVPQVIVWHPSAISSLDPLTGQEIWSVPFRVRSGLSIPTPRKIGNRLFVTAFYNGPMMLEVATDGRSAKVAWQGKSDSEIKTDGLHSIMPTPIVTPTHIYGVCSYGQLRCLDSTNGKRLWMSIKATGEGRWWNAFLIQHEDRVFIHNEQGDLIIATLSPSGYEEISRAKLVEPTRRVQRRMTIWSHPAFAMKSVFARNDREIVRVNLAVGE